MPCLIPVARNIYIPNAWRYASWVVRCFQKSGLVRFMTIETYIATVLRPQIVAQDNKAAPALYKQLSIDIHRRPDQRRCPRTFVIDPNDAQWLRLLRYQVMKDAGGDLARHGLHLTLNGKPLTEKSLLELTDAPRFAVVQRIDPQAPPVDDMAAVLCERKAAAAREQECVMDACDEDSDCEEKKGAAFFTATTTTVTTRARNAVSHPLSDFVSTLATVVSDALALTTKRDRRVCNDAPRAYAATYCALNAPATYVRAGIADPPQSSSDISAFWARHGVDDAAQFASDVSHDVARAVTKLPDALPITGNECDAVSRVYRAHILQESVLGRLGRSLDALLAGQGSTVNVRLAHDFTPVPDDSYAFQQAAGNRTLLRDAYSRALMWLTPEHRSGLSPEMDAQREAAMRAELYSDWSTITPETQQWIAAHRGIPHAAYVTKATRPHRCRAAVRIRSSVEQDDDAPQHTFGACVKVGDSSNDQCSAASIQSGVWMGDDAATTTNLTVHRALVESTPTFQPWACVKVGSSASTPLVSLTVRATDPLVDSMPALKAVSAATTPVDSVPALKPVAPPSPVHVDSIPALKPVDSEMPALKSIDVHTDDYPDDEDEDFAYYDDDADDDDEDEPPALVAPAPPPLTVATSVPAAAPSFVNDLIDHIKASPAAPETSVVLVVPTTDKFSAAASLIRGLPADKRAAMLDHYVCATPVTNVVVRGFDTGAGGLLTARSGTQWEVNTGMKSLVVAPKSAAKGTVSSFVRLDPALASSLRGHCGDVRVLYTDATHRDV